MKPVLKLGFTDTFDSAKDFFVDVLSRRFIINRDDIFPDYLIFGDPNFGQNHFSYNPREVTKIFYTGENVRPNYFTYDYALTFDFENSPRHYRLPLYVLEMFSIANEGKITKDYKFLQGIHGKIDWEKEWDNKTGEISYIQSNPNCSIRTMAVQSQMKRHKVDCGGPHLNNIGYVIPRERKLKVDFLRKRKLNMAFENGAQPGYVTEKLLDAFYAYTLPIYWGSENINRDFNPNSFFTYNVSNSNLMIDELLNDKKVWCDIMSQPRFKCDMLNEYTQLDNFLDWFCQNVYRGTV